MLRGIIKNLEYGLGLTVKVKKVIGYFVEVETMHGETMVLPKTDILTIPCELSAYQLQKVQNNLEQGLHPLQGLQ